MISGKKGMSLGDLAPAAIAFVFISVVIGVGATVVADVQDGFVTGAANCNATSKTACGTAYNVSGEGLSGLDTLASWLPTIALVIAAAIVIGTLAFFRR